MQENYVHNFCITEINLMRKEIEDESRFINIEVLMKAKQYLL